MTAPVSSQAAGRRTLRGRSLRWNEERATAAYRAGWWQRETLADTLARVARDEPDRILVKEGGQDLTATVLRERASRLASSMAARMPVGSSVTFMLPNWHEAAEIYLAASFAGMVVNPVLPSLRDHDLQFILGDIGSRMIFSPAELRRHDYVTMLTRVTAAMDTPPEVVVLRGDPQGHTAYEALFGADQDIAFPDPDPDAVHMIMYTSGTTGVPKGVMHTQNTLRALVLQLRDGWKVEPGDRFLVPSPVSHIGGSIYTFEMPLLLGTTAVLLDQWDAAEALSVFSREKITHMAGATPFLHQLLAAAHETGDRLPHLKVFVCGGASVPSTLVCAAAAQFSNAAITRVYGSTEVPLAAVGVVDSNDLEHASQTEGRAAIASIRLAPDGEILLEGPQMLVGYLREEHEVSAFDVDGYFRTGDQGRWVDDDYLVVTGRLKDVIIRNGENIAPKEVEDLLIQHRAIAEVAIVGLPDERTGERACAVIVPAAGDAGENGALTVPVLGAYLQSLGIARFKIPEQVEVWQALPKNDAGKVLKHKIRAELVSS